MMSHRLVLERPGPGGAERTKTDRRGEGVGQGRFFRDFFPLLTSKLVGPLGGACVVCRDVFRILEF